PYTVIISERDETIYVTVESGEVQGWVEGDRQEINTSDGNTITGVEPGDVQWDGGNTQTIVSQGGRSISMELYDN
ncbi:fimbrillin family protein, partial [Bacteroides ovatus]